MSILKLAARNLARSKTRTVGVIMVVAVTLGMFLILANINSSVVSNTSQIMSSVDNVVSVQNSSITSSGQGFGGPNVRSAITANIEANISNTPHVVAVQRIFSSIIRGSSTGSISPGSNFTVVEGIDTNSTVYLFGGMAGASSLNITSGSTLNSGDEYSNDALIGEAYSSSMGLSVNSSMDINGTSFTVIGIFSTGNNFTDRTVIVPYPAGSAALNISAPSLIYVTIDYSTNVQSVVSALQAKLGSSYQVSSLASGNGNGLNSGISSILSSVKLGEYATLIAGAMVMVVVMGIVTNHRIREIGVMKAIGYSNGKVISQFLLETLSLAVIGLPFALLFSSFVGPKVASLFLKSGVSSGSGQLGPGLLGSVRNGFSNLFAQSISFSITPEMIMTGLAVTICFAIIGAIYPIMRAIRLKPAEALRHE